MRFSHLLLLIGLTGLVVGGATLAARTRAEDAQTTYWANGHLQARTEVREGKPDGRCERFYPDGTKQAEGRYEAGRMEGEWLFWRADGTVDAERTGTYRDGVRQQG
jgi:antitoxin component YwqK of YwqJK toxin-antitoxin module